MRRFEFRAWDSVKKKMVYHDDKWYRFKFGLRFPPAQVDRLFAGHLAGVPTRQFIFMEWTGLVDKDGQKVFEDDIVRLQKDRPAGSSTVAVVKWEDRPSLSGFHIAGFVFSSSDDPDDFEVIGNIYENPGLICDCEKD